MLEGDRQSQEEESQDHTFYLGNKKGLDALLDETLGDIVASMPERKIK